jgi:hypothetical protein
MVFSGQSVKARDTRVLVPSNRRWYDLVSAGTILDFEDAMKDVASTEFLYLPPLGRRAQVRALRSGRLIRPAAIKNGPFDVCLLILFQPDEIRSLAQIRDLRRNCRKVAVYIFDAWLGATDVFRRYRKLWRLCDRIFVSFPRAAEVYSKHVECGVEYLPQAINPNRFHPFRDDRPIHLLSVGRRLESAHGRLLEIAQRNDLWYQFSEFREPHAIDLAASQYLLGRACQSARVQICWPVEMTHAERPRPGFSDADGSPVTVRWFEAAASGSRVLGARPRSREFAELFPFPTFVRDVDLGSGSKLEHQILAAVEEQSDSSERHQLADYVRCCHTWQARCAHILDAVGAR